MNGPDQHDRSASVSERRKRPRTQPAEDVRSREAVTIRQSLSICGNTRLLKWRRWQKQGKNA